MSCKRPIRARAKCLRSTGMPKTLLLATALAASITPAAAGDAPGDLGSALQRQQSNFGAVIGAYECRFVGTQLLGLPAALTDRPERPEHVTITIFQTGITLLNGIRMEPVYQSNPGETTTLGYSLHDVLYAMSGIPTDRLLPQDSGNSENLMGQYEFAKQFAIDITLSQGLMAGRDRYMLVALDRDELYFVDLTAQNKIENPGQAECYRTQ